MFRRPFFASMLVYALFFLFGAFDFCEQYSYDNVELLMNRVMGRFVSFGWRHVFYCSNCIFRCFCLVLSYALSYLLSLFVCVCMCVFFVFCFGDWWEFVFIRIWAIRCCALQPQCVNTSRFALPLFLFIVFFSPFFEVFQVVCSPYRGTVTTFCLSELP